MSGFGSILKDYLEYYKISQSDFAERLGISFKHMNEILNDNADISVDLMMGISLITDINPNTILKVESQKKVGKYLLNKYKTEKNINQFFELFFIKELVDRKWIKLKHKESFAQTALDLLEYLSVNSFDNLNNYLDNKVLYKKKDDSDLKKVYLWIKRCDSLIKDKDIPEYKSENLVSLLNDLTVERIRKFDEKVLIELFNKYGIYLVIEDALKGTKIRGCMMVKGKNPTIYMTKYLKEKSSFYFALYHELSHVKTDYNKAKSKTIVDSEDESTEYKADIFALNQMIDEKTWNIIINNLDSAALICKENNIPLTFLYSRLAKEGYINYKNKEYIINREVIQ